MVLLSSSMVANRAAIYPIAVQVSRDMPLPVQSQWYFAFFLKELGSPLLPSPIMKARGSSLERFTRVLQPTCLWLSGLEVVTTSVANGNFFVNSENFELTFRASRYFPDSPIVVLFTTRSYMGSGKSRSTK